MDDEPLEDNVERRSGIERRSLSYFVVIPERRSGEDNRSKKGSRPDSKDDKISDLKT